MTQGGDTFCSEQTLCPARILSSGHANIPTTQKLNPTDRSLVCACIYYSECWHVCINDEFRCSMLLYIIFFEMHSGQTQVMPIFIFIRGFNASRQLLESSHLRELIVILPEYYLQVFYILYNNAYLLFSFASHVYSGTIHLSRWTVLCLY